MPTIKDIAELAGVSISTVSHVVNQTRYVSPELVEKVERAIHQFEYPPNFVVKKQKSAQENQKSGKGIVFLKSGHNSFFGQSVEQKILQGLKKSGYFLLTANYQDPGQFRELDETILSHPGIVGLIAFPGNTPETMLQVLQRKKLPLVMISNVIDGISANYIASDSEGGTYRALMHLIRNGHEHIAFLCEDFGEKTNRYKGFSRAMEESGLPRDPGLLRTGLTTQEKIYAALDEMFERKVPPTAVFAGTHSIVAPLFQYMNLHNIHCPKDLSVIGFNDFEWATLNSPPITIVRQDADGIAEAAVRRLIELIEEQAADRSEDTEHTIVTLPAKLVVRSSTSGMARGPFGEKADSIESLTLTAQEMETIAKHNYTAAISFHYMGKAWMDLTLRGITSVFKQLNISLIATTDAHFNPELQSKQLESICLLEPDVIISMPTDNKKTAPTFQKVAQSKAKLILITNVPDGLAPGDYVSCISTNERSHGRNIGQGLGEYMTAHGLKNALFIKHGADFYGTNQRDAAAEQILSEEYAHINICGSASFLREEDVYGLTLSLLQKHPEAEALYVSWDGPALEAMRAIADTGRHIMPISTGDLDYNTALVMAGGGMIRAISAQSPYEQGEAIALAAANALLGKATPSFVGIEPVSVTPDNLLKAWAQIFKENPPTELREALKKNMLLPPAEG
ncbi:MAG: LacI family DNA-binding transcriptional regulator [Oscillospiraceae bacterium]|nr:LacI family DNA-binding transcriptional regulator [Oscillospiraceae bacterium]